LKHAVAQSKHLLENEQFHDLLSNVNYLIERIETDVDFLASKKKIFIILEKSFYKGNLSSRDDTIKKLNIECLSSLQIINGDNSLQNK
jgi:hypothetical protein